jgi:hypothetical protein
VTDVTDSTDEQRTIAFFEQWGVSYDAMIAAFYESFAPDCRWEQRPSDRGIVWTERVDHLRRADGRLIVSAPVAGIVEWRDGRIVAWREYFDSATFVGRALPRLVTGAAERAAARLR